MDFGKKKKLFFFVMLLVLSTTLNIYAAELTPKKLKYSINLMWINKSLNKDQLYIHPSKDEKELEKNFLSHIFKWAEANQDGVVNVWFDSAAIPAKAVDNTLILIKNYADKHPKMAPIGLRDVRKLSKVIENPKVFSGDEVSIERCFGEGENNYCRKFKDRMPVYFRVDLLRPIIALHILSTTKEADYFVYADLDMEPLSQEQLFDDETMVNLGKYGIVMARGGWLGFENGFQIISNDNKHLFEAIEWALIQLNIERAYNALKGTFYNVSHTQPRGSMEPLQQVVYDSYLSMFKYFYYLEGYGKLTVPKHIPVEVKLPDGSTRSEIKTTYRDYDKDKDGLKPFGLEYLLSVMQFTSDNKQFEEGSFGKLWIPTKKVNLPPAGLEYN